MSLFDFREHSYMTSDFWVGRYVQLHLMISDVGRWVGQRRSDVRSAILEFWNFCFFVFFSKTYFLNFAARISYNLF